MSWRSNRVLRPPKPPPPGRSAPPPRGSAGALPRAARAGGQGHHWARAVPAGGPRAAHVADSVLHPKQPRARARLSGRAQCKARKAKAARAPSQPWRKNKSNSNRKGTHRKRKAVRRRAPHGLMRVVHACPPERFIVPPRVKVVSSAAQPDAASDSTLTRRDPSPIKGGKHMSQFTFRCFVCGGRCAVVHILLAVLRSPHGCRRRHFCSSACLRRALGPGS